MIWLLANWRLVALAVLIAIPSTYAAVMKMRFEHVSAEYAQHRAQVAAVAAEAEVRNAHAALEHEKNAREVLDDLQTRLDAVSARYERLRKPTGGSSGSVPATTGAAPALGAGLSSGQPDAVARCVADAQEVLELGDREIAKYRELWELGVKNAQ